MQWLDGLIQGVLLGGLYAQYALGMALMFGVMRIVNISHGDLVILLSLIGISMATAWGLGPLPVLIVLVPLAVLMGWVLQKAVLNRVVGSDPLISGGFQDAATCATAASDARRLATASRTIGST